MTSVMMRAVGARSGTLRRVGVEQVVGAHVVLVHGLLDQPHPERAGVEGVVFRGLRRDGGEVMDAGEVHGVSLLAGPRASPRWLAALAALRGEVIKRLIRSRSSAPYVSL